MTKKTNKKAVKVAEVATNAPDASKELVTVISAYEKMRNKERELKDTRKEGLDRQKEAFQAFDECINAGRTCSAEDSSSLFIAATEAWDTYKAIKKEVVDAVKAAKEVADDARKDLDKTVAESKQMKLFVVN